MPWLATTILIVVAVAACQPPASPTPAPGGTPSAVPAVTTVSTATPPPATSLATGSPIASSGAVLGDPEERFVARLGPPGPDTIPGTVDHFQRAPGTPCDGLVVFFSNHLARAIVGQTCSGPVPAREERLAQASQYAPADRVPGNSFQTANGDAATSFTSASLARQLPTSAFHDCNGQALPAGTFAEFLSASGWEIATGTCP
jgi:hypothetical protein